MKIKRTVAPDMRQAIRRVREEQGPDAVILGNRRVAEGVEIISALDLDPEELYRSQEGMDLEEQDAPAQSEHGRAPASEPQAHETRGRKMPVREAPANRPRRQGFEAAFGERSGASPRHEPDPSAFDSFNEQLHRLVSETPEPRRAENTQRDAPRRSAQPRATEKASAAQRAASAAYGEARESRDKRAASTEPQSARRNVYGEQARPVLRGGTRTRSAAPDPMPAPAAEPAPVRETSDNALAGMQQELRQLRGMMQNQMSVMELGRLTGSNPLRVTLLSRLYEFGVGTDLAKSLIEEVQEKDNLERAWRQALGLLSNRIPIADDDFMSHGGVIAMVGPTGVGKTTTIAKIAARFAMRHGSRNVALVSTDNYRVGAQEQLLNYARILNVPVKMATNSDELSRALNGLYDKKLVLIDTAGMSQRDMRLSEQFTTLREGSPLIKPFLAMSATTQLRTLDETVKAFSRVDLAGCVITKLDEVYGVGAPLTAVIRHRLPVAFLGVGQRVPEDLQLARAHRLVSRVFMENPPQPEDTETPETMAARFAEAGSNA